MKLGSKTIATSALLLGVATAAHAQSSVTIFGLLDANVGRYKGAAAGVTPTDVRLNRQDASGLSTSFLGFRGSEDLGDGLNAFFELHSFMRNDVGQSGRNDAVCAPAPSCSAVNVAGDPFWAKAAFVGLGHSKFGRVRLGQITTAIWISSTASNAFGDSTTFSPINLLMFIGSPLAGGTGWTNSVAYDSPTFGGFSANLQKSFGEGPNGGNYGGRIGYTRGPLIVSLGYSDVRKDPVTFADGTSRNNTKNLLVAVGYDMLPVRVFAHLGRIRSDGSGSATTADDNLTFKIWDVSGQFQFGASRVMLGYGERKGDERFNSRRRLAAAGYAYSFSKRTEVYALLRDDKNRAAGTAALAVEAKGNSYAVGMRHYF